MYHAAGVVMKRLVCGDCVAGLAALEAGSVDCVFADPPFNIGYTYDAYKDNLTYPAYVDWSFTWLQACDRVLRPGGALWVVMGDSYAAEVKCLITGNLRYTLRNWCIWHYKFGVHCQTKFTPSHAHIFYAVKPGARHVFNAHLVREPSARLVVGDKRADPRGRVPADVWTYPRVAGTHAERQGWHPCQVPEALVQRALLATTDQFSVVLDPFAGSGTTLAVADRLRRDWIGFEISSRYCDGIASRVGDARRARTVLPEWAGRDYAAIQSLRTHERVWLVGVLQRCDEGDIVEWDTVRAADEFMAMYEASQRWRDRGLEVTWRDLRAK